MSNSKPHSTGELFQEFVAIIAKLRDPQGGCPWDLEQTHVSLKPFMIEEAYEALDAIDHHPEKLPEELGDVLLQVVLHAQIAADEKRFSIDDVIDIVNRKMITRHPHVFGDKKVADSAHVLRQWEDIKDKEQDRKTGALSNIPRSLPGLLRAHRMGEKAARVGFDWSSAEEVQQKVIEEIGEFVAAQKNGSKAELQAEFGDLLFALVQLARKLGFSAEEIMDNACQKFQRRFEVIEERAGADIKSKTAAEFNDLWLEAKKTVG